MGNQPGKFKTNYDSDDSSDDGGGAGSSEGSNSMHSNMLRHRNKDVFKKYKVVQVLGNGSMGFVAKARVRRDKVGGSAFKKQGLIIKKSSGSLTERRQNEVFYAIKSIQLDRVSPLFLEELHNEIGILKEMDHPNIVKAHEVYDYKQQIYIVLELCDGGDLYTRSPYSEKESAEVMGKLLSAIKYMHDRGIVHRDLKYENIMFENDGPDAEIKVIDFGLSKKFIPGTDPVMNEGVGTVYTMAPQVLQGVYTSQADLWSAGVICYMLLSAHRPFHHKRRKIMIDRIMRVDYSLDKEYWEPISSEAKDLVSKLLVLDPKERLNATNALLHPWLSKEFAWSDRKPDEAMIKAIDESLVLYKYTSRLKKIALNVIAHKSSTDEILQLRKAFDQYDAGHDGIITFEEFREAMKNLNYTDDDMHEIFDSIDINQNGHLMYTEFLAAALEAHGHIEEERIADAFDQLDYDGSGYLSKADLKEFLGDTLTGKEIDDIIKEGDNDKDGQLSYKEFLELFRRQRRTLSKRLSEIRPLNLGENSAEDENLVGLDANIPGGKHDSDVDDKYKRGIKD